MDTLDDIYHAWRGELLKPVDQINIDRIAELETAAYSRGASLVQILASGALVAAPWDADRHPRGKDGKFIELMGWVNLTTGSGNQDRRGQVTDISPDPANPGKPKITVELEGENGVPKRKIVVTPDKILSAPKQKARLDAPDAPVIDDGKVDPPSWAADIWDGDPSNPDLIDGYMEHEMGFNPQTMRNLDERVWEEADARMQDEIALWRDPPDVDEETPDAPVMPSSDPYDDPNYDDEGGFVEWSEAAGAWLDQDGNEATRDQIENAGFDPDTDPDGNDLGSDDEPVPSPLDTPRGKGRGFDYSKLSPEMKIEYDVLDDSEKTDFENRVNGGQDPVDALDDILNSDGVQSRMGDSEKAALGKPPTPEEIKDLKASIKDIEGQHWGSKDTEARADAVDLQSIRLDSLRKKNPTLTDTEKALLNKYGIDVPESLYALSKDKNSGPWSRDAKGAPGAANDIPDLSARREAFGMRGKDITDTSDDKNRIAGQSDSNLRWMLDHPETNPFDEKLIQAELDQRDSEGPVSEFDRLGPEGRGEMKQEGFKAPAKPTPASRDERPDQVLKKEVFGSDPVAAEAAKKELARRINDPIIPKDISAKMKSVSGQPSPDAAAPDASPTATMKRLAADWGDTELTDIAGRFEAGNPTARDREELQAMSEQDDELGAAARALMNSDAPASRADPSAPTDKPANEWGPAEPYNVMSKKLSDAGAVWNSNLKLYELPDGTSIRKDDGPNNTARFSVFPPGVNYWTTDTSKVTRFGSVDEALSSVGGDSATDVLVAPDATPAKKVDKPEGDFKPRDWATTWKNAAELDQHIAGLTPEQRMKEFEENSKNPRAPKPASRLKKMSDDDLQATYAVTTGDVELNREFKIELSRRGLYEKSSGDSLPDSLKKDVAKKVEAKPVSVKPKLTKTASPGWAPDDPTYAVSVGGEDIGVVRKVIVKTPIKAKSGNIQVGVTKSTEWQGSLDMGSVGKIPGHKYMGARTRDDAVADLYVAKKFGGEEQNVQNMYNGILKGHMVKLSDGSVRVVPRGASGTYVLRQDDSGNWSIESSKANFSNPNWAGPPDGLKIEDPFIASRLDGATPDPYAPKPAAPSKPAPVPKAPTAPKAPTKKPSLDDPAIKKKLADVEMMFNEEGINYTPKGLFESRGRKYIAGRVQEARASGDNTITVKVPSGSEVEVPLDVAEALLVGLPAGT